MRSHICADPVSVGAAGYVIAAGVTIQCLPPSCTLTRSLFRFSSATSLVHGSREAWWRRSEMGCFAASRWAADRPTTSSGS